MMKSGFFLLPLLLQAVPPPPGREPIAPLISGDTFRAHCDFALDEASSFHPEEVRPGSSIFIRTDHVDQFFRELHPRIVVPYVLVSHNADAPAPGPYASYLDDAKLLAWFALNYDGTPHPKMHPIPIGFANRYWPYGNHETMLRVMGMHLPHRHLAYFNMSLQSFYPERWPVFKQFAYTPFCYRTGKKPFEDYLKDIASSLFVISPKGLGLDTYRLWEALYLGAIPIVRTSSLDSLYAGLPVLIVQDWQEVTEEYLREKYDLFQNMSFSLEKLDFEYWQRQIDQYKEDPS